FSSPKSTTQPRLVDSSRTKNIRRGGGSIGAGSIAVSEMTELMRNKLLPLSKGTLAVLASMIVLLAVIGSRKTPTHENKPSPEFTACRFVLASLPGNEPID